MKKSAVEFLKEKLEDGHLDISNRYWNALITEAKSMEKCQIIEACRDGWMKAKNTNFHYPQEEEYDKQNFKSE